MKLYINTENTEKTTIELEHWDIFKNVCKNCFEIENELDKDEFHIYNNKEFYTFTGQIYEYFLKSKAIQKQTKMYSKQLRNDARSVEVFCEKYLEKLKEV